jgi:hypothetical protein
MKEDLDNLINSSDTRAKVEKAKKSEKYAVSDPDYLLGKLY